MDYLKEYTGIFNGEKFLRHGNPVTIDTYRAFDGGGGRALYSLLAKEVETRVSVNLLDFGCGEAIQWYQRVLNGRTQSLTEIMKEKLRGTYRYDPCVAVYSTKPPVGCFDIIMCSDVMEHIPETDIPCLIREIDSYGAEGCLVLYAIATTPSANCFIDGTNMHITQRPPTWWEAIITANSVHRNIVVCDKRPSEYSIS